jgi:AcrR family transcriptional regulator
VPLSFFRDEKRYGRLTDQEEHTTLMIDKADFLPSSVTVRTEPVQQRSADRITHLLDAAADLIDEQGIDGLTTSDVAIRSRSSVGVVYRYFPNIQSLLRALAARNMEKFTTRVFSTLSGGDEWMAAMNSAIDAYVDLMRTEPGFRALGFGDVIDKRFLQPDASNNSVLAKEFNDLFVQQYKMAPTPELSIDLEIVIEISDALIHRAFLYQRDGEERYIEKLRGIVFDYMSPHAASATR